MPTCEGGPCVSSEARLKVLKVTPTSLSPAFDPDIADYTAEFSYFEPTLTISALPMSPDAIVSCVGASLGPTGEGEIPANLPDSPDVITVDVTAVDETTKGYEVALKRAPLRTTYFKAFNARTEAWFGQVVALDGDSAVVGSPAENSSAQGVDGYETLTGAAEAGAAYVATRVADGMWRRQAYLKASDTSKGALFGTSVGIDQDTIVVGSPGKEGSKGAAYIFSRSNGTWSQQAMLTEPTRGANYRFGSGVAVQGDHVYVGANTSPNLFNYDNGAVYAWTRSGDTWTLDEVLPNPPATEFMASGAEYGTRIVAAGDRLAVSGFFDVYVMVRQAKQWAVEGHVTSVDLMGIAFDGDSLAVASLNAGVHVYTRSGSSWTKQTTLLSFDAKAGDFGTSVALTGNLLVVGSRGTNESGGISTFVRNGATWQNGQYIAPNSVEQKDNFGYSVAASGARILVGAWGESSSAKGFNGDVTNNAAPRAGAAFFLE